ncbi:MAG: AI-2E family transporter [Lachnospiraceae bacterium]|nr:AI-2E family transporter [Lachnospiraceae bacterium]
MKKFDYRFVRLGITIVVSLCICILFFHMITNGAEGLITVKDTLVSITMPIIDGLCLAYLLNPAMMFFEDKLVEPLLGRFKKIKDTYGRKSLVRGISVFITITLFILLIAGLLLLIVPQLVHSIESIVIRMPRYMNSLDRMLSESLINITDNNDIAALIEAYSDQLTVFLNNKIIPGVQSFISSFSTSLFSSIYDILVWIFNFVIGIIISIYLLFKKELHIGQTRKVIFALFSEEKASVFLNNMRFVNNAFGGFISGKIVDSFIIAILCFIGMALLKLPYALLISSVVGVTNVIPYFGPFIGAIPSAFILLMISPKKCLIFLLFIVILQQIDGNILGPKILGPSTGLSSFWVIFAITIFGGLFGFIGMFIGVPVFAVIYAAFRTYIEQRLKKKSLPVETSYYMPDQYEDNTDSDDEKSEGSGDKEKFIKKPGMIKGKKKDDVHFKFHSKD